MRCSEGGYDRTLDQPRPQSFSLVKLSSGNKVEVRPLRVLPHTASRELFKHEASLLPHPYMLVDLLYLRDGPLEK